MTDNNFTKDTVAAVVVTHNRLELLQRCIKHLSEQTKSPDAIYIVNVASTDGTRKYLDESEDSSPPVKPIHLDENVGGGGGQNAGIKRAVADGYDWVWCMDDDGYADREALAVLCNAMNDYDALWLNSMVIDPERPAQLAFGLSIDDTFTTDVSKVQAKGPYIEGAAPFNGTLLHRSLIEAIGLPAPELFIWGDEREYVRRAKRYNFTPHIVTLSHFYHRPSMPPDARILELPLSGFWKCYYLVRNHDAEVDNQGQVRLSTKGALTMGRYAIRILLADTARNIIKISIILRAIFAAWRNDLKRHYP